MSLVVASDGFRRFTNSYHPTQLETLILQTAAGQGWLDAEQVAVAEQALAGDPTLSACDYLLQQGWVGEEHVEWLRQQMSGGTASTLSEDQTIQADGEQAQPQEQPVAESTTAPAQIEVGDDVTLIPTDINFEVQVAEDHALGHLNDYLKIGQYYGASDVHIGVAAPPMMRRHGCLQIMWPKAPMFTAPQTERLMMGFITEAQKAHFKERGDLDFCYEVAEMGRFRTSVVRQRVGIDGVFRIINSTLRTMDELGLPPILKGLTKFHNGLVLVTGSVGSGKSTTLASFIEEVNRDRSDHIITLEDPIEYVFVSKGCQVTQREVHTHTQSFGAALRAALREDPDVIMVGEMRDLETISLAITASETGHLVFGTLHTSSAARTLDRILDVFPTEQQEQIRTMVGGSLRGVISQQLVPRADGQGRVLALEVLINTPAAAAMIRDGKTFMLPGVMQTGKKIGCKLMDDSLLDLLKGEKITARDAYDRAEQKNLFKEFLTE